MKTFTFWKTSAHLLIPLESRPNCKSLHPAGRQIQPCWDHTSVLCLDLPPPLCNSDIVYLLRCQSSEPGSKFSLDLNSIHVVPPTVQVPANTSDAPSWSTLSHFLRQRCDHISLLSQAKQSVVYLLETHPADWDSLAQGRLRVQKTPNLIDAGSSMCPSGRNNQPPNSSQYFCCLTLIICCSGLKRHHILVETLFWFSPWFPPAALHKYSLISDSLGQQMLFRVAEAGAYNCWLGRARRTPEMETEVELRPN